MWFREKALVAVDSRGVAVAVYRDTVSGRQLLRFGAERLASPGPGDGGLAATLAGAGDAVRRLAASLKAPSRGATFLLPLGATFPSITDAGTAARAQARDVSEVDFVRFRLASLLPFPVSQAEVRTETFPSLAPGMVLAQAVLSTNVAAAATAMTAWGFPGARISSVLSAAFGGLSIRPDTVDLILGDSACAVCARDARGLTEAIHLRLLSEGEDRGRRALEEARRAAPAVRAVRVIGEDVRALASPFGDVDLVPAFEESAAPGDADPQRAPFLAFLHRASGRAPGLPDFGSGADEGPRRGLWRAVRLAGVVALAYTVLTAAVEGRAAWLSGRALNHARDDVAKARRLAEDARRALQKNADVLTLVASVESSPARVRADLAAVVPPGVDVPSVRIEYGTDGVARLDLTVLARSSDVYDRFLTALSKSPRFAEIRPGSEMRPGLVRAAVSAVHRPDRSRP